MFIKLSHAIVPDKHPSKDPKGLLGIMTRA